MKTKEIPPRNIEDLATEIESLRAQLEAKDLVIGKMQDQITAMRRVLFGRRSERFISEDPAQLKLDFEGVEVLEEEQIVDSSLKQQEGECVETKTEERVKSKVEAPKQRRIFSEHLERRDEFVEPDDTPQGSKRIGEKFLNFLKSSGPDLNIKWAKNESALGQLLLHHNNKVI